MDAKANLAAFQAVYTGSIPVTRFNLIRYHWGR